MGTRRKAVFADNIRRGRVTFSSLVLRFNVKLEKSFNFQKFVSAASSCQSNDRKALTSAKNICTVVFSTIISFFKKTDSESSANDSVSSIVESED